MCYNDGMDLWQALTEGKTVVYSPWSAMCYRPCGEKNDSVDGFFRVEGEDPSDIFQADFFTIEALIEYDTLSKSLDPDYTVKDFTDQRAAWATGGVFVYTAQTMFVLDVECINPTAITEALSRWMNASVTSVDIRLHDGVPSEIRYRLKQV